MLQVGIVGLPNVGKSSLFNALTAAGAAADNYPFCTLDPNIGTVAVPDPRLERIREMTGSAVCLPTVFSFVDIAGLVKGASRGEGLGNRFLGQIREVDAVAHVVRCFEDPDVTHVMDEIDPVRDMEVVETELIMADLETVERRKEKVEKQARSGEEQAIREMAVLEKAMEGLGRGVSLRHLNLTEADGFSFRDLNLLSAKPVFYIANVPEDGAGRRIGGPLFALQDQVLASEKEASVIPVSLAIEAELALLPHPERSEFLAELGLGEGGATRVIRAAFGLLGLVTFFSTNGKQTTAWAIPAGTRAPEAAGTIHTDFQRGFIRAEAIGFDEFERLGSMKAARESGAVRSEGKDYVVADGDILLFRFNL